MMPPGMLALSVGWPPGGTAQRGLYFQNKYYEMGAWRHLCYNFVIKLTSFLVHRGQHEM